MSFTKEERDFISSYLSRFQTIKKDDVKNHLSEEIYAVIKDARRVATVCDRTLYINKSFFRPYETVYITKFLTTDFDIADFIKEIAGALTGNFLIFVDCHFLFVCAEDENKTVLKFQCGTKASAFNTTVKISTSDDYQDLVKEFDNLQTSDILNTCFEHHRDLFDYRKSGIRPFYLLSLSVQIQKI